MKPKVKFCGMTRVKDINEAEKLVRESYHEFVKEHKADLFLYVKKKLKKFFFKKTEREPIIVVEIIEL